MLLIDDQDELPEAPTEPEQQLIAKLGASGLRRLDETILKHARSDWLKVARVVVFAMKDGGFSPHGVDVVRLHVRRVGALVEAGALEAQGNLRKPRWSEVRLANEIRR